MEVVKMTRKVIILSIILSITLFSIALADATPTYSTFDFQPQDIFRLYYGSTRALSFGGACYVNGNDLGALLFNPAEVMTMPDGNLGISGITANGALEAQYAEATITPRGETSEKTIETFTLVPTDSTVFYPTFAGIKLGSLAIMYSKPYFIPVYRKFETDQSITAPDSYSISYNQFAFYDDFTNFNIYSAVLGLGNKILAGGVRATYFDGPVVRYVRGISSDNKNYWYRKEKVDYDGYTVDVGAMINLFLLKAGIVYKNAVSNINYTKTGEWADTYSGGYYSQDSTETGILINTPYIVGSVGADIGILKAEISAYDLDPKALQEGVISAAGIAVGGEASIGILQTRVGARMPFGKFRDFVNDPNQLAFILFDPEVHLSFGIGASLGPIQADVAFGKNILMQALTDGDLGNYWSINTGFNLLF
jgi:hypothetical protein